MTVPATIETKNGKVTRRSDRIKYSSVQAENAPAIKPENSFQRKTM
jgi:hypothetical protein